MAYIVDSDQTSARTSSTFLGKVLLWMCYGILLTFGFAFLFPYIVDTISQNVSTTSYVLYISSGIGAFGILFFSIFLMFKSMSIKGIGALSFSLYAIFMGLALSPLYVLTYDPVGTLGILYSLLITAGMFLIMGLIGVLSKGRLKGFYLTAIGLILGSFIISMINIFVFNDTMYWIASFAILIAFMLFTAWDFNRISKMSALGQYQMNFAITCALSLYSDFIVIFIRLLPIVLSLLADRN